MSAIDEEGATPLLHELTDTRATSGPENLMEQLRARRQELADTKETYIVITGFEEQGLCGKHRLMDRIEVEKIGRRIFQETKDRGERNMRIVIDTIINSTIGFYVREGDQYAELPGPDGQATQVLTWDQLAEGMGWQPNGNARAALYFAFGDNEFAIGQYGIQLNRWMGNTGVDLDEEFLGGMA